MLLLLLLTSPPTAPPAGGSANAALSAPCMKPARGITRLVPATAAAAAADGIDRRSLELAGKLPVRDLRLCIPSWPAADLAGLPAHMGAAAAAAAAGGDDSG